MPISFLWILGISAYACGQLSHRLKVTWHWLRFRFDSSLSANSVSLFLTPVIFDSSKEVLLSLVFLLLLTLRIIRYTRLHTNKNRQNQGNDHTRGIVIFKDLDNKMQSYKMIHFHAIYEMFVSKTFIYGEKDIKLTIIPFSMYLFCLYSAYDYFNCLNI